MNFHELQYKIRKHLNLVTPDMYLRHLRNVGVSIGKGTKLFDSYIFIDEQRPWMISIGEYCKITRGVVILQHDYSRSVLRRMYGEIVGESQKTIIGNNVFIGMNSIILMGSHIGDDSIVAAGSIVNGTFPSGVVIGGNPAKILCTLEDYYIKRKSLYIAEAVNTYREYKNKYGRTPSIREMGSFWPIFLPKDIIELNKNKIFTKLSGDEQDEIIEHWLTEKEIFSSYEDFCKYANMFDSDSDIKHAE